MSSASVWYICKTLIRQQKKNQDTKTIKLPNIVKCEGDYESKPYIQFPNIKIGLFTRGTSLTNICNLKMTMH